ncbi:hypothetical protein LCGC14_1532040, partial [marine sediment metagenome]
MGELDKKDKLEIDSSFLDNQTSKEQLELNYLALQKILEDELLKTKISEDLKDRFLTEYHNTEHSLDEQTKKIDEILKTVGVKRGVFDKKVRSLLTKKKKIQNEKSVEPDKYVGGIRIDNYLENAKRFYEIQQFFYDKAEIFWFWKDHHWEMVDDVEVERKLDSSLGFMGQTVSSGLRKNHLTAIKWVGRENKPEESPKRWIQFKDKAFSLRSGKLYDVKPNYFFTNPIPWSMGENDKTPTMDKLFEEWVGKKYVPTLYELVAYCCYQDYPIQVLFCLYGIGRNGKSCFFRLLTKFLGAENICSTELDLLVGQSSSRFEKAKLYKKLVCQMGETNFGILQKSSILKKLTGGDLIGFEMKNKSPFDDYSYSKILIASNSLPSSEDTSEGFYRRWIIIDFPNQFPEGKDIIDTVP